MADVTIELPPLDLGKVDTKLIVRDGKAKLGELHFSKGNLDWWPKGRSVNKKTITWLKLAELIEAEGTAKKVPRKKVAAPAPKPKVTAKTK